MASTIYYGKSVTAPGEQVKQVIVQGLDSTVTQESDFLTSGDMLSIHFASKNTHSTPYIKLYNGSLENEIAASGDNGNQIKIQTTAIDLSGIWSNGEVCSFTYVEENNVFYWYLTDASLADTDVYGKVKLQTSFAEGFDPNSTITAGAIMDLVSEQKSGSLEYIPNGDQDIKIGTLKLLGLDEQVLSSINLYTPEYIDVDTFRMNTNELVNNGPRKLDGETESEANIGFGHPYITRIVPGRLSFTHSFDPDNPIKGLTVVNGNSEFIAYELSNNLGDSTLQSQRDLILIPNSENQIILGGTTEVDGEITFNDKMYVVLTDEDEDLYNNLIRLGWDDCL